MHYNCEECTRLWSEYALATRHYLKLEGRLQIAAISQDETTVSELSPLVRRANEERDELRRQIEEHEGESRLEAAVAAG